MCSAVLYNKESRNLDCEGISSSQVSHRRCRTLVLAKRTSLALSQLKMTYPVPVNGQGELD